MVPVSPNIKCLIFDCDGTLADSMEGHWQAWHETFAVFGKTCPQEFLDRFTGVPAEKIVIYFNETFGQNINVQAFLEEKIKRVQAILSDVKPIEPVVKTARYHKGKLPMAVASGGKRVVVDATLKSIGLDNFFDTIVTADDPVAPKPSPDIFLEVAKRLNVKPQFCQVFEDGDPGLEAARKAGMIATDIRPYY